MAKIFYSMAGEGRGHATRVRTVVEMLRDEHEITLFAPAAAYSLLSVIYMGTDIRVRQIPGLMFQYCGAKLDHWRTLKQGLKYLRDLPRLVSQLTREVRAAKPDLVITDFEPALPRAAQRAGVPFLSVDHQHSLVVNDLSPLPWRLRWQASLMALIVRAYYRGQADTIVSSFCFPPLKHGCVGVIQTGVLLRPDLLTTVPVDGDHLFVYVRRRADSPIIAALEQTGVPCRIYGLGELPDRGHLSFRPISETGFLDDLRSCRALVSTAGNQLVGEALYLGKPVLAIPESGNFEQAINAHFLAAGGGGEWSSAEDLRPERIRRFLGRIDEYSHRIDRLRLNGNDAVLRAIRRHLPEKRPQHTGPVRWDATVQGVAG